MKRKKKPKQCSFDPKACNTVITSKFERISASMKKYKIFSNTMLKCSNWKKKRMRIKYKAATNND